jgi:hypothetical protein
MIDHFAAESIQFVQSLSKEAKESGLELGNALAQIIDDIPALEAIRLQGTERESLQRHLSTLRTIRQFVERAQHAASSMPKA